MLHAKEENNMADEVKFVIDMWDVKIGPWKVTIAPWHDLGEKGPGIELTLWDKNNQNATIYEVLLYKDREDLYSPVDHQAASEEVEKIAKIIVPIGEKKGFDYDSFGRQKARELFEELGARGVDAYFDLGRSYGIRRRSFLLSFLLGSIKVLKYVEDRANDYPGTRDDAYD